MKKKSNFDQYLEKQMATGEFAERYAKASEAWEVALQLSDLRRQAGLSQEELARRLGTTQQQISRMESPAYEGHSLRMLRRVAGALNARLRVTLEPKSKRARQETAAMRIRVSSRDMRSL